MMKERHEKETELVNGENVSFDAYNINGNNYFKLRDTTGLLCTIRQSCTHIRGTAG